MTALAAGLTVSVLIRLGDGRPTEVAEVSVPLTARLAKEQIGGVASAYVELDWELLNARVADALRDVAEQLPKFGPGEDR